MLPVCRNPRTHVDDSVVADTYVRLIEDASLSPANLPFFFCIADDISSFFLYDRTNTRWLRMLNNIVFAFFFVFKEFFRFHRFWILYAVAGFLSEAGVFFWFSRNSPSQFFKSNMHMYQSFAMFLDTAGRTGKFGVDGQSFFGGKLSQESPFVLPTFAHLFPVINSRSCWGERFKIAWNFLWKDDFPETEGVNQLTHYLHTVQRFQPVLWFES